MTENEKREIFIRAARDAFYVYVIATHLGIRVKIHGKEYFFSGYGLDEDEAAPDEARSCEFILRDWFYNEFPEKRGKFVRGFKDEFDLMENFKIDGKCLRQLVEDGEVDFLEMDE